MGATRRPLDAPRDKHAQITAVIGGREIRGRCYDVESSHGRRIEIELTCGAERALVDVPADEDPQRILLRAIEIFAESLALSSADD